MPAQDCLSASGVPSSLAASSNPHICTVQRDWRVPAQDDDGAAYIAYSSEGNRVMHLSRLSADLCGVAPAFERALVGLSRESPVLFKHAGVYFMLTSGCTGWQPNRAEVFYATCAGALVTCIGTSLRSACYQG